MVSESNSLFSNRMIPNPLKLIGIFIQWAARFDINPLKMGKKLEVFVYPKLSGFRKIPACWKVPRLLPSLLLVRTTCVWKWIWIVVEMILTGENQKPCLSVTLSTTNVRRTELGSNPALRGEKIKLIVFRGPVRNPRYTPSVRVMKKKQVFLYREMITGCCKIIWNTKMQSVEF